MSVLPIRTARPLTRRGSQTSEARERLIEIFQVGEVMWMRPARLVSTPHPCLIHIPLEKMSRQARHHLLPTPLSL